MNDDFEIRRQGTEIRLVGRGKTKEGALSSLARAFAAYQLPEGEAVDSDGERRELKFGYEKEAYLPPDLINDIIGLQAANSEAYPRVEIVRLADGIICAELFGVKKGPRSMVREAVYSGSKLEASGDGWVAETEIVA